MHLLAWGVVRKGWTMKTCPCKLAVPLDYSKRDAVQTQITQGYITTLGEFISVNVGGRWYRVSRHCIALHGVKAVEIESYGFEEVNNAR